MKFKKSVCDTRLKLREKKTNKKQPLTLDDNETEFKLHVQMSMKCYETLTYSTSQSIHFFNLHHETKKKFSTDIC